jgi:hypothetical protein
LDCTVGRSVAATLQYFVSESSIACWTALAREGGAGKDVMNVHRRVAAWIFVPTFTGYFNHVGADFLSFLFEMPITSTAVHDPSRNKQKLDLVRAQLIVDC